MTELSDLRREYARFTQWGRNCAICWVPFHGHSRRMELAHIISRGRAGSKVNRVENVVFLCDRCHESQHRGEHTTAEGETWPNILDSYLVFAKHELGELDSVAVAGISGCTMLYVMDQVAAVEVAGLPATIAEERRKWSPIHSRHIDLERNYK